MSDDDDDIGEVKSWGTEEVREMPERRGRMW